MQTGSSVTRWLAGAGTLAIFAAALSLGRTGAVPSIGESAVVPVRPEVIEEPAWPMFGGSPARNMANPLAKGLPVDWEVVDEPFKNVKWVADLGSNAFGSPVIAGGKVFIGTNNQRPRDQRDIDPKTKRPIDAGVLMCFRESDGKFLWQAVHPRLPHGREHDWPLHSVHSTPVVEGNRLYYVSNRCELICADTEGFLDGKNDGVQDEPRTGPTDADIIWRLDMIGELGVFPHNWSVSSPLIDGDLVFVVTGNGVNEDHIEPAAPVAPSFIAVNKKTGKVVWQDNSPTKKLLAPGIPPNEPARELAIEKLKNKGKLLLHGQWSSPTLARVDGQAQVIFPGGDGWLRSFAPANGKLLWKFDCNPKAARFALGGRGTRSEFWATPVMQGKHLYIGVGQEPEYAPGEGHLWCIDVDRATAKGRLNKDCDVSPIGDNFDPRAAANRDSALVWQYGGTITDPQERIKLKRSDYFSRTMSTCAVHDGLCYAADYRGILHCLDAVTGQVYWRHNCGFQTQSSPFVADGKVYLGYDDDTVIVFLHGKQKKILATNDMGTHIRAVPTAVNGVLYVATDNKLYALAVEKK